MGVDIRDIAWDSESKRIAVCGEGRGRYAPSRVLTRSLIRAVMWDTGSDLGEFTGHSRGVNRWGLRRPARQRGLPPLPPVPPGELRRRHAGVVLPGAALPVRPLRRAPQELRPRGAVGARRAGERSYSPDGALFASVGSDKAIHVFDGKVAARAA